MIPLYQLIGYKQSPLVILKPPLPSSSQGPTWCVLGMSEECQRLCSRCGWSVLWFS